MQEIFDEILQTSEFQKLKEIPDERQQFNLFALLDDSIDENSWSRFVTFLFNSKEKHGLGISPFQSWWDLVEPTLPADKRTLFQFGKDFETHTKFNLPTLEGRYLDILIEVKKSNEIRAVIGIENKVDAGEQPNQIRDYQTDLCKRYVSCPKVIFFLTPDERESKTQDSENRECPCVSCSYKSLVEMCGKTIPRSQGEVEILLSSMSAFLKREILGELTMNPEAKKTNSESLQE